MIRRRKLTEMIYDDSSDRYYDSDCYVEMIADNLWISKEAGYDRAKVPDVVYECKKVYPTDDWGTYLIERIDENCAGDEYNTFFEDVSKEEEAELNSLINEWVMRVGYHWYEADMTKPIPVKDDILALIDEYDRENGR